MFAITGMVQKEHASDLSGILSTMVPLATLLGISTFGSRYFFLVQHMHEAASRTFGVTALAFAISAAAALLAASAAARESRDREARSGELTVDVGLVENAQI
jgi:hypothetical protein